MFYLKHNGEKLEIRENNVFAVCPVCSKEHPVDLQEILHDGEGDLYGTAVYCPECSRLKVMSEVAIREEVKRLFSFLNKEG